MSLARRDSSSHHITSHRFHTRKHDRCTASSSLIHAGGRHTTQSHSRATHRVRAAAHIYFCSPHRVATTHTHTHTFNGPLSGTTRVSRYQNGKTNPDFTEARDSEWQWHQLGHMQVCTLLQTDNHTPAPHHSVFYLQVGRPSCRPTNTVKALKHRPATN